MRNFFHLWIWKLRIAPSAKVALSDSNSKHLWETQLAPNIFLITTYSNRSNTQIVWLLIKQQNSWRKQNLRDIKRWILRSFLLHLRYLSPFYLILLLIMQLTTNTVLIYCVTACSATTLPELPGPNGNGSSRLLDPAASWVHPAKQRVQTRRSPWPQNRRIHYSQRRVHMLASGNFQSTF